MNINLSMDEIQLVAKALETKRAQAKVALDQAKEQGDDIATATARQHYFAIGDLYATIDSQVSSHLTRTVLDSYQKAVAE